MEIALVLVDIQNDYFPGGKNPLYNPEKAAENAENVHKTFMASLQETFAKIMKTNELKNYL